MLTIKISRRYTLQEGNEASLLNPFVTKPSDVHHQYNKYPPHYYIDIISLI